MHLNPTRSHGTPKAFSGRGFVGSGAEVLIGGFVIAGDNAKTVLISGRGPSMDSAGVTGTLQDPALVLFDAQRRRINFNDDWQASPERRLIEDSGMAPRDPREAAMMVRLEPGPYTVHVSGKNGAKGLAQVVVAESPFDYGRGQLVNLSTRDQVLTGDNRVIASVTIQGDTPRTVVFRGLGPSLASKGVTGTLENPVIYVVRLSDRKRMAANDDWGTAPNAEELVRLGLAPADRRESAILATLEPGVYSVVMQGQDGGAGVGLVSIHMR